jgi:hypothetical protein
MLQQVKRIGRRDSKAKESQGGLKNAPSRMACFRPSQNSNTYASAGLQGQEGEIQRVLRSLNLKKQSRAEVSKL